jgi:uncharacterized iron-regulated membrane protein
MKRLRKIIFWCHLPIGLLGGTIILIMCVTGVLLTYEKQIIAWADTRNYNVVPPSTAAQHLPIEQLLTNAKEKRKSEPSSITKRANANSPVEVSFGREGTLFLNPYTGEIFGEGARGVRSFFRTVTDWHRWLGAQGENRNTMRAITGACNLGFLILVVSGLYLWWPQRWSLKLLRNNTWFRRGLPSKARDFNWHNVIGFWSAVPLFIIVLSGVVISYTWAGNLVYRIVGENPPAPRANQPASTPKAPKPEETASMSIDSLWPRAAQQVAGWQSITLQLTAAADAPLTFSIDRGNGGQPQKRAQLVLDRKSGNVVRFEPFSSNTKGRQLRSILRFAHTGEVLGIVGQTIAGLVSGGGAFLVYTGFALAWRRFRAWWGRRSKSRSEVPSSSTEVFGTTGD